MAIQKKTKCSSVANPKETRKKTRPSAHFIASKKNKEVYDDFLKSLEALKLIINSEKANLRMKEEPLTDAFDRPLEFIDSLIEKSRSDIIKEMPGIRRNRTPSLEILTKREQEVLKLIANGLANKNIAQKLKISIRTAEVHRSNLTGKLGIKTTAGLVKYAFSKDLI